jgi:transcriptional regulator with XRE-family HTH domain
VPLVIQGRARPRSRSSSVGPGRLAARLIRQARHTSGLTQRALAARSGTPQPAIARAENSHRDLLVAGLDRLLRSTGHQLIALPTLRSTAAETADVVRLHLAAGREDAAYRDVIQLNDDLVVERGALKVALAVATPATTGDDRYDAFIAGVVDWRLSLDGLPRPTWVDDVKCLDACWWVDPTSEGDAEVVAATPTVIRRRGVIIDEAELRSV